MTATRSDLSFLQRRSAQALSKATPAAPSSFLATLAAQRAERAVEVTSASEGHPVRLTPARVEAPRDTKKVDALNLDVLMAPKKAERHALRRLEGFPRLKAKGRAVLGGQNSPVMALSRVQSGTGTLAIKRLSSGGRPSELGCILEDASGKAFLANGRTTSRSVSSLSQGAVLINLRHIANLRRFLIFSSGMAAGALTVETISGSRIEMEVPADPAHVGILSGHNVDGALVLRRELVSEATLRGLCDSFGYSFTWLDPNCPLESSASPA